MASAPSASRSEAATDDELFALEAGALDPARFPHSEHLRLGYEMLERYSFGEAVTRFSWGLKLLAAKAGRPEVYHETITVAFLAVIGERRGRTAHGDWSEFKARNGDLLDKRCLEGWYGGRTAWLRFSAANVLSASRSGDFQIAVLRVGGLETAAP